MAHALQCSCNPGIKTAVRAFQLELKTIADVGLVGYPNVGKSTILSVVTAARPKIANYHFTTLTPNLGIIRRHGQDIVLADIEMPGMNGLNALEQLRSEGIQPHVVIMTAYSSERYLKESLSLRVFAYLEKPIHRNQVEATLRALILEIEEERERNAELLKLRE